MTGTGGWAYYSATHYMLGIRPDYEKLVIDPCISAEWDGFTVKRQWRGALYEIEIKNPLHCSKGIKELFLDGRPVKEIPVMPKGSCHSVEVIMG